MREKHIFSLLNWESAAILYPGVKQPHLVVEGFRSSRGATGVVSTDGFANQAVAQRHTFAANGSRVCVHSFYASVSSQRPY